MMGCPLITDDTKQGGEVDKLKKKEYKHTSTDWKI